MCFDASSYMIAHPCEKSKIAQNTVTQVKAVGYCLPISCMLGHWVKIPNSASSWWKLLTKW